MATSEDHRWPPPRTETWPLTDSHTRALRALANRLIGMLHGCLAQEATYDEYTAWAHRSTTAA